MTKYPLCQDVNLSEVIFFNNGRSVAFILLSMHNGRLEAKLSCDGVICVKYHTAPSAPLPLYVGEVFHEELDVKDSTMWLRKLAYGFTNFDGTLLSMETDFLQHVHLEGGEIDVDILCSKVIFNRCE